MSVASESEGRLAQKRRRYTDARATVVALMRERGVDSAGVLKLAGRVFTGRAWQRDPPFDRRERLKRYAWDFRTVVQLNDEDEGRQERAEGYLLELEDADFLGFDPPSGDDLPTLQYAFLAVCELCGVAFWSQLWSREEREGFLSLREMDRLPKAEGLVAAVGSEREAALILLARLAFERVIEQAGGEPFNRREATNWSHEAWNPPEIPLIAEHKVHRRTPLLPGGWSGGKRTSRPFLWDEGRLRKPRRLDGEALRALIVDSLAKSGYSLEEAIATVRPGRLSAEQQLSYDAIATACHEARTQGATYPAIGKAISKGKQAAQRLAKHGATLVG